MPRARKPGNNRGGPRQGTPGKTYTNRSDLNTPDAPPSAAPAQGTMVAPRPYGAGGAQPPDQPPAAGTTPATPSPPRPPATPTSPVGLQGMPGNQPPPLMRPTDKPQEPLTAGVPVGPGPNQMPMPALATQDTLGLFLRELYRAQPSEDVRQLILQYEGQANKAPSGPLPPQGSPQGPPPQPVAPPSPLASPSPGPQTQPPVAPPTGPTPGAPQGLTNGP